MTVIGMAREMGTRGKEVVNHLVDRLDVQLVHHELVEAPFDRRKAPGRSEVHRFLNGGAEDGKPCNSTPAINGYMTPEEVFALARRGNVIIRGWGQRDCCIQFRISCPYGFVRQWKTGSTR